jgi:hypothetical protein
MGVRGLSAWSLRGTKCLAAKKAAKKTVLSAEAIQAS